jgi:cobalamin biosynthesis Mg chelatase CobN
MAAAIAAADEAAQAKAAANAPTAGWTTNSAGQVVYNTGPAPSVIATQTLPKQSAWDGLVNGLADTVENTGIISGTQANGVVGAVRGAGDFVGDGVSSAVNSLLGQGSAPAADSSSSVLPLVVGGVVVLALVLGGVYFWRKG